MQRITEKQLQAVVDRINRETNSPMASYTRTEAGRSVANVGNYHLYFAYGAVQSRRATTVASQVRVWPWLVACLLLATSASVLAVMP